MKKISKNKIENMNINFQFSDFHIKKIHDKNTQEEVFCEVINKMNEFVNNKY